MTSPGSQGGECSGRKAQMPGEGARLIVPQWTLSPPLAMVTRVLLSMQRTQETVDMSRSQEMTGECGPVAWSPRWCGHSSESL